MAKKSALSKPAKEFISSKIKKIMYEYTKTGMIGKSKPANRNAALRQAIAVAFSMAKREGFKVPKKAEEYHSEVFLFGAEGLTVDTYRIQDSFVRDVFTYPYTPPTSRTTTILGGESIYFKEGRIHGYVLRKNDTTMDILISGFTGVAYFTETKEKITSGEKLKGKVALNINNRFLALYDDVWREDALWSDSDKNIQQESWQLDWDSEEYDLDKINSMTIVEKIFITSAIGLCFLIGNRGE